MEQVEIKIETHNGTGKYTVYNVSASDKSIKYDYIEDIHGDQMPALWEMSYNTEIEQAVREQMKVGA